MTALAPFVRAMGRGPGRARSLTGAEAQEAMELILAGRAAPEAVGALLMLMRYRGETADELAGFVAAMRAETAAWAELPVALDWPVYAAGRTRGLPWFLLAARLVARGGHPVLVHGLAGPVAVRAAAERLGLPLVATPEAAARALVTDRIACVPLEALSPRLAALLALRATLGLRSPVNSALRLFNPAAAPAAVQGVFHPTFRALARDAGHRLGQPALTVIKGGGGEFERHPGKAVTLQGLRAGVPFDATAPALVAETRRLADADARPGDLAALWHGAHADPFAEAVVTGTAALALHTLGAAPDLAAAETRAAALWAGRAAPLAA